MKIALCGSGKIEDQETANAAKTIGREIAKRKHILITGGGAGYPYFAVRGAFIEHGSIIAYSPAKDEEEHKNTYRFPIGEFSEIAYTGLGVPGRNMEVIKNADAVIILDGKVGTLNEFTIALQLKKRIGILKGRGITKLIPDIAKIIGNNNNIIYEQDPKKLIERLTLIR